jgi:hypothetical protein
MEMNGKSYRIGVALLAGLALTAFALPAVAQPAPTHLDVQISPTKDLTIPPNHSLWHELAPTFCRMHEQFGYADNGDGIISICDWFNLRDPDTGQISGFHVEWVGPTFWLDVDDDGVFDPAFDAVCEPHNYNEFAFDELPQPGDDWDQIYPNMAPLTVVSYQDNGDLIPGFCDYVDFGTGQIHVLDVTTNVRVSPPGPPVANERTTWGKIKSIY